MRRKPIKIDWDQLDDAFNRKHDEVGSYLDIVTGHVVLDGEGEDDGVDQDDPGYIAGNAAVRQASRLHDPTRVYVSPPDTAEKIKWLRGFLAEQGEDHPEVTRQLTEAISAKDPARALGDVLNQNPDVRDAWYLYRSDRIHEKIEAWVAAANIEPVDPPPWD